MKLNRGEKISGLTANPREANLPVMRANGVLPSAIAGAGGRTGLSAMTRGVALAFGEEVREELAKPAYRDLFFAGMRTGLAECDRTCMRLYAEAHRLVGQQVNLSVLILNELGAPASEAKSAVMAVQDASRMDDRTKARRMLEWLAARGVDVGGIVLPAELQASGAEVEG